MRDWMNGWDIEVQRTGIELFAWNLMPERLLHPPWADGGSGIARHPSASSRACNAWLTN